MNKTELISEISNKAGVSKADASKMLEAFTDSVIDALKKGEKVQLIGFGTFETVKKPEREARNPRTGEMTKVSACTTMKMKVSSKMKEILSV